MILDIHESISNNITHLEVRQDNQVLMHSRFKTDADAFACEITDPDNQLLYTMENAQHYSLFFGRPIGQLFWTGKCDKANILDQEGKQVGLLKERKARRFDFYYEVEMDTGSVLIYYTSRKKEYYFSAYIGDKLIAMITRNLPHYTEGEAYRLYLDDDYQKATDVLVQFTTYIHMELHVINGYDEEVEGPKVFPDKYTSQYFQPDWLRMNFGVVIGDTDNQ